MSKETAIAEATKIANEDNIVMVVTFTNMQNTKKTSMDIIQPWLFQLSKSLKE